MPLTAAARRIGRAQASFARFCERDLIEMRLKPRIAEYRPDLETPIETLRKLVKLEAAETQRMHDEAMRPTLKRAA